MRQATLLGGYTAQDTPSAADFAQPEGKWTALLNYYPPAWGSISAHRDTSEPSLTATPARFYPVVSLSVGNAAAFKLWPQWQSEALPGPELTVQLCTGDALVFGGAGRLVRHAITDVTVGGKRPEGLTMVAGRLNVTIRRL